MEKAFEHNKYEDNAYARWEKSGHMRANAHSDKPPFTIPLPPPNVTGQLHLGHAAMLAVEDILIRHRAMTGHEVLWVPGTDHAAIATENVVLKHLGSKSREEYSRADFLSHCRDFAQKSHDTIINQTKKMGAWLDWSREAYTMDDDRSNAVSEVFAMLREDGLIEKGYRMVNWSVGAQSVLADDEVEWEDRDEVMYHIQCGPFVIGTVRPETKCADSAVVVNPDDERYRHLIGTSFEYETYAGKRQFHVIADEHVDPELGTGAMTISTAHDANDYAIAKRHDLPFIEKINRDGRMTAVAGPCAGLTVKQARKKSVEIMREKGLIVAEKPYAHSVPLCYRTGTVVEPMLSDQWYVMVEKPFTDRFSGKQTTLKELTLSAVRDGHVDIIPERFRKIYFQWIENLRDWCISRQIWWGHQIPIWYDENGIEHGTRPLSVSFARHGESEANAANLIQGSEYDTPLTPLGQQQAADLATKCADGGYAKVISSDLTRAKQTANAVAERLGVPHEIWPELHEISNGSLVGQPLPDEGTVQHLMHEQGIGELWPQLKERAEAVWERVKQLSPEDGPVLFVSHSAFLAAMMAVRRGVQTLDQWYLFVENWDMENCATIDFVLQVPPAGTGRSVLVVRHGQSEGNAAQVIAGSVDTPLTELGKQQAAEAAEGLKGKGITRIISSNLSRAKDTAQIIADALGGIEIEAWEDLREFNYGDMEGSAYMPGEQNLSRSVSAKTGDTMPETEARMKRVLEKIYALPKDEKVLLVGHNTATCLLFATAAGKGADEYVAARDDGWYMNNCEVRELQVPGNLKQDPDTLDTWFSSALWAMSPLGWGSGRSTPELEKFFPTNVLETGHDIIFFWVARMIMFSRYATGKYPFQTVYLHGLVTDDKGKKMSKSKGNGIDPLDMISEYGADAVRLSLVIGTTPGNNIPIGGAKIKGYRNFVNKLWNATRFVQMQAAGATPDLTPKTLADEWILSRFSAVSQQVNAALQAFQMSVAGDAMYHFVWDEFCNWYIEASKTDPNSAFALSLMQSVLQLVHPLCPFITEACFAALTGKDECLITHKYPLVEYENTDAQAQFAAIQIAVTEVRQFRADQKMNPKAKLTAYIKSKNAALIADLAGLELAENDIDFAHPKMISKGIVVDVPFDAEAEKARLTKVIAQLDKQILGMEGKLSNEKYIVNAPEQLVAETREKLGKAVTERESARSQLAEIN